MNKLLSPLLAVVLVACASQATKEASLPDSTTLRDSAAEALLAEEETVPEPEVVVTDTSKLQTRFEEVSNANTLASEHWYTVNISTSQYEVSSDVTWYFDESVEPRYFKMTWSAEGNEGSTELFIENNTVICAQEEGGDVVETWCSTTGGTRATWGENDNVEKTPLAMEYGKNCNESFERYRNILKSLLKEGEISEQDETSYTIRIEKTVNYGEDFTESTEVKINKKVYEAITGA